MRFKRAILLLSLLAGCGYQPASAPAASGQITAQGYGKNVCQSDPATSKTHCYFCPGC